MRPPVELDGLSSIQLRELVASVFAKLAELERTIAEQREEIARLKGLKGRPDIKPSGMDKATDSGKPEAGKRSVWVSRQGPTSGQRRRSAC